jgi:hypothetical protein
MKITAVTPTRGDRPHLLEQCKFYMQRQSMPLHDHIIIDHAPANEQKDITKRFREGIVKAFADGADLVALIEDDDWYHQDYISNLIAGWKSLDEPVLFGIGYTHYYHVGINARMYMKHQERASAFCTLISRKAMPLIKWPADNDPFFDIVLWKHARGKTTMPTVIWALGIKHGIGLSGGMGHKASWLTYKDKDPNMVWLESVVGSDIEFYKQLHGQVRNSV